MKRTYIYDLEDVRRDYRELVIAARSLWAYFDLMERLAIGKIAQAESKEFVAMKNRVFKKQMAEVAEWIEHHAER